MICACSSVVLLKKQSPQINDEDRNDIISCHKYSMAPVDDEYLVRSSCGTNRVHQHQAMYSRACIIQYRQQALAQISITLNMCSESTFNFQSSALVFDLRQIHLYRTPQSCEITNAAYGRSNTDMITCFPKKTQLRQTREIEKLHFNISIQRRFRSQMKRLQHRNKIRSTSAEALAHHLKHL